MSDFQQNDGGFRPRRELIDVSHLSLKCAECQTGIDKLPFEPNQDRPVYCRDCNRNRRNNFGPRRF